MRTGRTVNEALPAHKGVLVCLKSSILDPIKQMESEHVCAFEEEANDLREIFSSKYHL